MATRIQVVFDCADPDRLAKFWAVALGYMLQNPPQGYGSWEGFLRKTGVPEDEWNSASAVVDSAGVGPRIYFQRVQERKIVKNRVHLDLNVSGRPGTSLDDRMKRVNAEVERLIENGATINRPGIIEEGEYWVVMQDPEGNEFCVQ